MPCVGSTSAPPRTSRPLIRARGGLPTVTPETRASSTQRITSGWAPASGITRKRRGEVRSASGSGTFAADPSANRSTTGASPDAAGRGAAVGAGVTAGSCAAGAEGAPDGPAAATRSTAAFFAATSSGDGRISNQITAMPTPKTRRAAKTMEATVVRRESDPSRNSGMTTPPAGDAGTGFTSGAAEPAAGEPSGTEEGAGAAPGAAATDVGAAEADVVGASPATGAAAAGEAAGTPAGDAPALPRNVSPGRGLA